MTPSPGATSSLSIALSDAQTVCKILGASFDMSKHETEIQAVSSHSELTATPQKEIA